MEQKLYASFVQAEGERCSMHSSHSQHRAVTVLNTHQSKRMSLSSYTSLPCLITAGWVEDGQHNLTYKSFSRQWYLIPWCYHGEEKRSICSSDVMVSEPWHMKSYPGHHILPNMNTNKSYIHNTSVYNMGIVFHCKGHFVAMYGNSQLWWNLKLWNLSGIFCGDKNWGWVS